MKPTSGLPAVSIITCSAFFSSLQADTPPALKIVAAQRRMDPTGAGSFHRSGLIREAQNTLRNAEKARTAESAKKAAKTKS